MFGSLGKVIWILNLLDLHLVASFFRLILTMFAWIANKNTCVSNVLNTKKNVEALCSEGLSVARAAGRWADRSRHDLQTVTMMMMMMMMMMVMLLVIRMRIIGRRRMLMMMVWAQRAVGQIEASMTFKWFPALPTVNQGNLRKWNQTNFSLKFTNPNQKVSAV